MAPTPIATPAREFTYLGNRVRIHADASDTAGSYAVLEMLAKPGSEPPVHFHENEDEIFIVIEGSIRLTCAGQDQILNPGDSATAKRGTPHTFKILSPVLRSLAILTPAGFEDFFRALAEDPPPSFERIAQVAAQYGSRLVP